MGFLKSLIVLGVESVITLFILAAIITILPGIPPDIKFEGFSITPPVSLGNFPNHFVLDKAQVLFESKSSGVESAATFGDTVYTGDSGGNLYKIQSNGESSVVAKFQYPCDVQWDSSRGTEGMTNCSWPLGMKLDSSGKNLYIADHYGGIVKVDVNTAKSEILVKKQAQIGQVKLFTVNDVDVAKDGSVYFSEPSSHSSDKSGYVMLEMYGEPSGRLIKHDAKTKTNTVLISGINFANGVCLSENEDFVLVSEITRARILRYYLRGPKQGQHDVFIDGLPGYADNIRSNGKGGFYVALFTIRNDEFSSLLLVERLANYPYVRKFLLRTRFLLLSAINGISSVFPGNVYIESARAYINHLGPFMDWSLIPKYGLVLDVTSDGKIVNVLRSNPGTNIHIMSQFTLGDKYAYLSFPFGSKVYKVKREDLPK